MQSSPAFAASDPATELGRARIADAGYPQVVANYANHFADGRPAKSTSIGIKDGEGNYVAALCLNMDLTPVHAAQALRAAGFTAVSDYVSARAPVPAAANQSPEVAGVRVQAWDGQGAEALLDRLFALAGGSFADKLFFKPIDRDAFLALYRPLLALIDPRLVLFAFDGNGEMAGFLFGLPDVAQGGAPDTAILKTYASRKPGVGHLLAHSFHERARDLGYNHVVHALMHVDNVSRERSVRHAGTVFRRYSLFGREEE